MPIGFVLIAATIISMFIINQPVSMAVLRVLSGPQSIVLTAIPFFTLAGILMREGGITKRILDFCLLFVGHFKGSLGHVNIVSSMIFGGISGSSVADTASIGTILIPEMIRNKYSPALSAAITAVSSTIGIIIPPSIPMILYAVAASESIGKLFLAGAIPGIMVGLLQMIVNFFVSKKLNMKAENEKRASFKKIIIGAKDGILAIIMPIIIIFGVSFGVVTATEAGVLAVIYAVIIGFFVYRELSFSKIPSILMETCKVTAIVMLIVSAASGIGWILAYAKIPDLFTNSLLGFSSNPHVILIIINIILLIVGAISDVAPNILIFTPILLPIIMRIGINPVHFGIIMILNQAIALVTPPVGNCLYVCSNIGKVSVEKVFMTGFPFLLANLIILAIVTHFPLICMWLPNLLMK
jgi:tripartite ATP-independent transporter DctM subunit